ncbi:MAG: PHP domain-containing protein [Candidatus Izemoplasmataceae bacterium]
MTPNNVLNMAMLKGLDIVAITDHNSTRQLPTIRQLEDSYDFLYIPAVEVTVNENFDALCYFRTYEDAATFDQFLQVHLDGEWKNFSESDQVITDVYDTEIDTVERPLTHTSIAYKDLITKVRKLDGAIILAHIDRPSQTPLDTYSLEELEFDGVELQSQNIDPFLKKYPSLTQYKIFHNSDAHSLPMISEKTNYIDLKEKTIDAFFDYLRGEK